MIRIEAIGKNITWTEAEGAYVYVVVFCWSTMVHSFESCVNCLSEFEKVISRPWLYCSQGTITLSITPSRVPLLQYLWIIFRSSVVP